MPLELALSDQEMEEMEQIAQLLGREPDDKFASEMYSEMMALRWRKPGSAVVLPFPVRSKA